MLAVGVGSALSNQASGDRLVQISGPKVVKRRRAQPTSKSLNDVDVALVTEFEDLAALMRECRARSCAHRP